MKNIRTLILGMATLAIFVSTANAQKLLRWKFVPGENIQVNFQQDMRMSTDMMGNQIKTTADMGMTLGWQVKTVSPQGVAEIAQSIERLQMNMSNPGSAPIAYDSASTTKPTGVAAQLAAGIESLVGVEVLQQLNPRGEILAVTLSPEAQAQVAKAHAAAQVQQVFSKEGMKALLHQAATVLPEKPVSPGDSWTSQMDTKSPVGSLHMDMKYTYRGTEVYNGRELEVVDVSVNVGFGAEPNQLGLKVKVAEQEGKGALFFDAAAGRFVSTQLNQNMSLETTVGKTVHRQQLETVVKMQFANRSGSPTGRPATAITAPQSAVRPASATEAIR